MRKNFRTLRFLTLWDGVWSLPLLLAVFVAFAYLGPAFFGDWFSPMPIDDLHIMVEAALLVISANFISFMGLWFNFRGLYRYYLNDSKTDFKQLQPWQKIFITLSVYIFYFAAYMIAWQMIA